MAPQASKKCGPLTPDHQQIGCSASNDVDLEQALAPSSHQSIATDGGSSSYEDLLTSFFLQSHYSLYSY